ncbi:hypothetical protein Pelo_18263 [Pelomyxa schiedti]|nr:hypothetical protein Pelo_18263 [Pelomyxa schiedti]
MQPQGTPQQPQATTEDDQQHTHQLKREPSFGATSSSAGRSTPRFQSAAVIPAYDTPSSPSPSPRVIMGGGAGGGGAAADSRGADSAGHTPRRGGRRRSSYFDTIEATTPLLHHSETYNTVYLTTTAPPPPHTQPQRPPQPPPTRNDRGHQHQHHPHHRNQQQQGPRREQGVGVGASVGGEGSRGTSGVSVEGTAVICTSVSPAAGVSDGDAEGGYRRRAEGNAAAQDGSGGVEVVVPGADYGPVMSFPATREG